MEAVIRNLNLDDKKIRTYIQESKRNKSEYGIKTPNEEGRKKVDVYKKRTKVYKD